MMMKDLFGDLVECNDVMFIDYICEFFWFEVFLMKVCCVFLILVCYVIFIMCLRVNLFNI